MSLSLRALGFSAALLIYALFSTPTPDHIGLAEILVMTGLLAAMGAGGLMQAAHLRVSTDTPLWLGPARILLLYGLSVPLLVGLAAGHPVSLMMRDIIPFLFLMLPLFLPPQFIAHPRMARALPWLLALMGVIFVARVLAAALLPFGQHGMPLGFVPDADNLVNAPTVLFAALFLTGMGGLWLPHIRTPRLLCGVLFCFAGTLLLLGGMAAIGQRAHIGAWVLTVLCWLAILLVYRPRIFIWPSVLGVAVLLLLWPYAFEIYQGLMQKHTVVGLNNRVEEARAVWESFRAQPWALLWGQGWGASIVSPAVGPDPVNYTHNIFTTFLLKGGLAAVSLVFLYILALLAGVWRLLWAHPVRALAVAAPFLIDITLYASFKSLDFGLLLVLIALWTRLPAPAVKVAQPVMAGV